MATAKISTNPAVLDALEAAAALCRSRGVQFTELRQRLLAALVATQQPMGAYELLHELEQSWGKPLVPMTVYRALEFLLELDLIARIESRNAYVPRKRRDRPHASVFFVCSECLASIEVQSTVIESALMQSAVDLGFDIQHTALELQGLCARCQETEADKAVGSRQMRRASRYRH
jgi:Fur family transcriptional regulator, zinc uptake regulator